MKKDSQIILVLVVLFTCRSSGQITSTWNFNTTHDRTWINEALYPVPLEDWRVKNGRIETLGEPRSKRLHILTHFLRDSGDFEISIRSGLIPTDFTEGVMGISLGIQDETDKDVRSLVYHGKGIPVGIRNEGNAFIGETEFTLPENFDFSDFEFRIQGKERDTHLEISLILQDSNGEKAALAGRLPEKTSGMIAIFCGHPGQDDMQAGRFWFDSISLSGTRFEARSENTFGPILFNMYTLYQRTLKMSVQMPPLGLADSQDLHFQIKNNGAYRTIATAKIQQPAALAVFELTDWDKTKKTEYRLVYHMNGKDGKRTPHHYEGIIAKEPNSQQFKVAGMTCQHWQAYPYRPVVENLVKQDPDMLFFSGDQIYEVNGGYDIERKDPEKAITNYLGKWYMFGWAFGKLMKDRPTICIPDDHEVYQGNFWGEGGETIPLEDWQQGKNLLGGFVQPVPMLQVVLATNTAHLPTPFDSKPLKNGLPVYHSALEYSGISFAIIGDRVFKSSPDEVAWWNEGRKDHITTDSIKLKDLEKEDLVLLGDRQHRFLEEWATDWHNVEMKSVLSQTMFANIATHHGGEKMFLYADLDSGGWPKKGRDQAVALMRKAGAFHISGDQHLTMLAQYGIQEQQDAGWGFCTPAISVGYERRFEPDKVDVPIDHRPSHNLPNTGAYRDFFRNPFYVQAVGNPLENTKDANRYRAAQKKASGFGMITFDKKNRTITADAIPFLANWGDTPASEHFDGFPVTIGQMENYGSRGSFWLPTIQSSSGSHPVVKVYKDDTLIYAYRMNAPEFQPQVAENGRYTLKIGNPESNLWQSFDKVKARNSKNNKILKVKSEKIK